VITFEQVDNLFKSYGLVPHPIKNGQCFEYDFEKRFLGKKKNVATRVTPLMNGGVGGYLYVDHLQEFENHPDKTKMGHYAISHFKNINDLTELLEKVIVHYR
jgi:hypothetical protein